MAENNNINPDRLRDVIDKASQHARMIYYLYLGFISYCAVTVFSTTDRQLALKGDKADLPILNISVPLDGFFIIAPILCIGLFVYFMLYLHRLNTLVDESNFNKRELFPWMINIVRDSDTGAIGFLQRLFVRLTLWYTLPIILFIFALWVVKKHDTNLSYFIIGLFLLSNFITYWFWYKLEGEGKKNDYKEVLQSMLISLLILGAWYAAVILIPAINDGERYWANLDLTNEILVTVPSKDAQFDQGYWVDLEGVNLNGADISNTVIKKGTLKLANLQEANLSWANLQGANLIKADLKGADLIQTDLRRANLWNSDLQRANLTDVNLQEANLSRTNFQRANLTNANLQETDLYQANLRGAILDSTNFQGADLEHADLENTILHEVDLKGAMLLGANLQKSELHGGNLQGVNLEETNLQRAYFLNTNLQDAKFSDADLHGTAICWTDLTNAKNLYKSRLCKARTLYKVKMDEDLLKEILNDKECAYKLTQESFEKWEIERKKKLEEEQQNIEE